MRDEIKKAEPPIVEDNRHESHQEYNLDLEGFSTQGGSNNWAISGNHTESGHVIIANDPHTSGSIPSLS